MLLGMGVEEVWKGKLWWEGVVVGGGCGGRWLWWEGVVVGEGCGGRRL